MNRGIPFLTAVRAEDGVWLVPAAVPAVPRGGYGDARRSAAAREPVIIEPMAAEQQQIGSPRQGSLR
jgi:hypothetical protein